MCGHGCHAYWNWKWEKASNLHFGAKPRGNLFVSCDPRMKQGLGCGGPSRNATGPLTPHKCAVQRLGSLFVYIYFLFRVTLTARGIQNECMSNRCCAVGCFRVLCTFIKFRRFASACSCIILLKVSWSIWTARHSSLAGPVRTKPEMYGSFL